MSSVKSSGSISKGSRRNHFQLAWALRDQSAAKWTSASLLKQWRLQCFWDRLTFPWSGPALAGVCLKMATHLCLLFPLLPIGSVALLLFCWMKKYDWPTLNVMRNGSSNQLPSVFVLIKMAPLVSNISNGLPPEWICEINALNVGNIKIGTSHYQIQIFKPCQGWSCKYSNKGLVHMVVFLEQNNIFCSFS